MHKLRGEIVSLLVIGGLVVLSLTSIVTVSVIKSRREVTTSQASILEESCNECYPPNAQGGCAAGYICKSSPDTACGGTKYYCAKSTVAPTTAPKPTVKPTSATSNCPSTGFFSTQQGCAQQCGNSISNCKPCKHLGVDKYYCTGTGGAGLENLPSCTLPNSFSGCPSECGSSGCEPCNASGVQKNHCKINANTANLKACTGGSYVKKADCDPHCVTQCSECRSGSTVKFECSSTFNNIPSCKASNKTYGSMASCQAPGECTGNCTLCEIAPGTSRYECNGAGPGVPLTQTPVGLGDCNSSVGIIANGQSKCSGSFKLSCTNGDIIQDQCQYGCINNGCIIPTPTALIKPSPTPIKTTTTGGVNTYTCGQGTTCPQGWSCNGPYVPYGYGVKYCTENGKPTPAAWCQERAIANLGCAHNFCQSGQAAEEWVMADCSKKIICKVDPKCTNIPTPTPDYLHNAGLKPSPSLPLSSPIPTLRPEYARCMRECIGSCITDPQGIVKCVPYSSVTTPIPGNDAGTKQASQTNCGGLYQSCCQEIGDFSTSVTCNNNLHCSSNLCLPDESYEQSLAAANELNNYLDNYVNQNPQCKTMSCTSYGLVTDDVCTPHCFGSTPNCCVPKVGDLNETIDTYINNNIGTDPLAQEKFKEQLSSSCTEADGQTPCSGSCVYSAIQTKFVCMNQQALQNQYEQIKEEGAKSVGDFCIPLFSTCKSEMLECVSSKCQIKKEAEQFLGYSAAENNQAGGKLAAPAQIINTNQDTPDLLNTFATADTQALADNKELAYGACSSSEQAGTYSLKNGQCWVCLDPIYNSMNVVPDEYCTNKQLQKEGANFGINCKQTNNNYCAQAGSSCASAGQSDCPNNWTCCNGNSTQSSDTKKVSNLNEPCREYPIPDPNNEFGGIDNTCKPGLKCFQGTCRDEISLAYDDNANSGTAGLNNAGGLMDMVINPMIRSISPDYYAAGEIRAEVTQSSMDSCYESAEANGTDPSTCDELYGTVDQLAQTNMTQNKLEEQNPDGLSLAESAYNIIQDLGKFASAYSGQEKTVSTLTYAEKSAEANADPNDTLGEKLGLDYLGAAVQPGLEIGMTVADIATLGIGNSILTTAGKALKTTAVEISQGAIKTGIKEIVEETAEQALKETAQQITEEVAEQVSKEAVQQITKETTQEAAQQILKEATQQAAEEVAEKITQESTQALVAETTQQAALNAAQAVAEEIGQAASKTITPEAIEQIAQEAAEAAYKEVAPKIGTQITGTAAQNTAKEIVQEAAQKAASEAAIEMAQEAGQKSAQEVAQQIAQKITQETTQIIDNKITKETVQETAQQISKQINQEFVPKITAEMTPQAVKQTIEEATQTVTREVAEQILTSKQTVSTARTTLAKGLNALGTAMDTGKMAEKLLEVPIIGPTLGFVEKAVGTVIAAPLMAGVGGLGLAKRGLSNSIFPDLLTRLLPNLTQSKIERTITRELSDLLINTADNPLTLQRLVDIQIDLINKYGDKVKPDQITDMLQKQALQALGNKPITIVNPADLWQEVQKALRNSTNLNNAILDAANKYVESNPTANIFDLIPQAKTIAEAQQLANRWGIPLNTEKQIDNYLGAYSKLLENQANGQITAPKAFVSDLVNGGMSFKEANKLAGGLIYDESPLLLSAKKAQEIAQKEFTQTVDKYHEAEADYQKALDNLNKTEDDYHKLKQDPKTKKADLDKAQDELNKARNELADAEKTLSEARQSVVVKAADLKNNDASKQLDLTKAQRDLEVAETIKKQAGTDLQQATETLAKAKQEVNDMEALLKQAKELEQAKSGAQGKLSQLKTNLLEKVKKALKKDTLPSVAELTVKVTDARKTLKLAQEAFDQANGLIKQADINLAVAQRNFDNQLVKVNQKNNWLADTWNRIFGGNNPRGEIPGAILEQKQISLANKDLNFKIDDRGNISVSLEKESVWVRRNGKAQKINPGEELSLRTGDEIYLQKNPKITAEEPKIEWLKVNKQGQLDHFELAYQPKADSQAVINRLSNYYDSDGTPSLKIQEISQIDSYRLKINNEPEVNFHIAQNSDFTGETSRLAQELSSTVQETRSYLGPNVKNINQPVDILIVSNKTNSRAFATGNGTIVMNYTDKLGTRDLLAHELTHQLTGISPLLSLTEGIAVYTGAMVTGGTLDAHHLTPDHRHYQDLVDLIDSKARKGGSDESISETQFFNDLKSRGSSGIEPQREYSYIVGAHYAQAIDQLHGIQDMVELMNMSNKYFESNWGELRVRGDLKSKSITVNGKVFNPGQPISNREALDFLLETKYGAKGKSEINIQVENNILKRTQNKKIVPQIDSAEQIVKVGRNKNNHWQIKDSHVSREQFTLAQDLDGNITLHDHSTNGTFVERNNVNLPYQQTTTLANGDRLILGGTEPPIEFTVEIKGGQVELKPDFPTNTIYQYHDLTGNPTGVGSILNDLQGHSNVNPPDQDLVDDLLPEQLSPTKLHTEAADFEIVSNSHGKSTLTITTTNSTLTIERNNILYTYGTLYDGERIVRNNIPVQPGDKITLKLADGQQITFDINERLLKQIDNGSWSPAIERLVNQNSHLSNEFIPLQARKIIDDKSLTRNMIEETDSVEKHLMSFSKSEPVQKLENDYIDNFVNAARKQAENMGKVLSDEELEIAGKTAKDAFQAKVDDTVRYLTSISSDLGNKTPIQVIDDVYLKLDMPPGVSPEAFSQAQKKIKQSVSDLAFIQHLENPEQFVSHGFNHTMNVVKHIDAIIEQNPLLIKSITDKYGLSEQQATFLLENIAIFHDFGYPEVGGLSKATHSLTGALILTKPDLQDSFKVLLSGTTNMDLVMADLRDAVLFHNADTFEKLFVAKVITKKGTFLTDATGNSLGENVMQIISKYQLDGDIFTSQGLSIKVASNDARKEIVERLVNFAKEAGIYLDDLPTVEVTNEKFAGRSLDFLAKKDARIGLEFKSVDAINSPFEAAIRFADNMDMTNHRFSDLQKLPAFTEIYTRFGDNGLESQILAGLEKRFLPVVTEAIEHLRTIAAGLPPERNAYYLQELTNLGNYPDPALVENLFKEAIIDDVLINNSQLDIVTTQKLRQIGILQTTLSMRHFGGCLPIQSVDLIGNSLIITVDEVLYNQLNTIKIQESGSVVGVGQYQIWRAQSAFRSLKFNGKNIIIKVFNISGQELPFIN